jgi:hypothetical protein
MSGVVCCGVVFRCARRLDTDVQTAAPINTKTQLIIAVRAV